MQFRKTYLLIFPALLLTQTLFSQTLWRGLRLPQNDRPSFTRHPLANSQSPATILHFKYEPEPVKPLLHLIHRGIVEANPIASASEEIFDIGKSTMVLEELSREAAEALANPVTSASETALELIGSASAAVSSFTESVIASAPAEIASSTEPAVASASTEVGRSTEPVDANPR